MLREGQWQGCISIGWNDGRQRTGGSACQGVSQLGQARLGEQGRQRQFVPPPMRCECATSGARPATNARPGRRNCHAVRWTPDRVITPNALRMRDIRRTPSNECPPRAKKLSCRPMDSRPSNSFAPDRGNGVFDLALWCFIRQRRIGRRIRCG